MKGLITRLINASKLNENEKQIKKKKWTDPNTRRKLNESEFEVTRRKKILTTQYYFVLFV